MPGRRPSRRPADVVVIAPGTAAPPQPRAWPDAVAGSSCSKPATRAAGRAPGTAAWSSRSSSTDRTRWPAGTVTPVGPCCGRRSPRTRSCATSWRTRRSRATGECGGLLSPSSRRSAGVAAGGERWVRPGSRCGCSPPPTSVGGQLGRLRRRAADGTDGRGAAGEAPRRVRRAGPHRGRRGTPPHAGDAPRATRSGVPRPDRARHHHRGRRPRGRERLRRRRAPGPRAARAAVGELHHRPRAPRARAGAIGDAGRPDVLRHQAPPELLAPVTRPADGVRRPRVLRGCRASPAPPERALRRDGARAPAAAGVTVTRGAAAWR